VGAAFGDAAAVKDKDLVGFEDRAEAVGDDDAGAVGEDALERLLDELFRFAVEAAGGFVKDQDARVAQDNAGQGNALFFAAAEAVAALADDGVVTIRQAGDEIVDVGGLRCLLNLVLGGVRTGKADVDGDGVVEQEGFLGDHTDMGCEGIEGEITQVVVVNADAALLGIIQARDEIGQRGLAGAAGADKRGQLAGLDREVDVLEGDRAGLAGSAGFRLGLFPFAAAGEDSLAILDLAETADIAQPAGFAVLIFKADMVKGDLASDF